VGVRAVLSQRHEQSYSCLPNRKIMKSIDYEENCGVTKCFG
jgi:hypothetical protein